MDLKNKLGFLAQQDMVTAMKFILSVLSICAPYLVAYIFFPPLTKGESSTINMVLLLTAGALIYYGLDKRFKLVPPPNR